MKYFLAMRLHEKILCCVILDSLLEFKTRNFVVEKRAILLALPEPASRTTQFHDNLIEKAEFLSSFMN